LAVVARVQSSKALAVAHQMAVRELAVAEHLVQCGASSLKPLEEHGGPHIRGRSVVTLWHLLKNVRTAQHEDAAIAAASLASLHTALRGYGEKLAPYTEALDHCWEVLNDSGSCLALSENDRHLLKTQFRRLRDAVDRARAEWVPLHGDAHLGNLLLADDQPVWVDFEDACMGPREYDIAALPNEAWPHFDGIDLQLTRLYADLRSVCVAIWCWADLSRSREVSEAAEHHLLRVRRMAE
jgi:Ser/Thr protein kinase RdoA (MazF antagonist)